jgi:hypothetical protein
MTLEALGDNPTPPLTFSLSVPWTQEVQSIAANGAASLAQTIGEPAFRVTAGQTRQDLTQSRTRLRTARVTLRVAPNGSILEQLSSIQSDAPIFDPSSVTTDLIAMSRIEFPQEPISVGESWIQVVPMSLSASDGSIQGSIQVRYTLAGYASWRGREVAVFDGELTARMDGALSYANLTSDALVGRGSGASWVLFDVQRQEVLEMGFQQGLVLTRTPVSGARSMQGLALEGRVHLGGLAPRDESAAVVAQP